VGGAATQLLAARSREPDAVIVQRERAANRAVGTFVGSLELWGVFAALIEKAGNGRNDAVFSRIRNN
jgi:hypothetical protein